MVASELVTNAVVHARTPLELRLEWPGSRLQVAVADQDPNLSGVLAAKDRTDGGLGLLVVDRVATAWGSGGTRLGAGWSGAPWPCPRVAGWWRRPSRRPPVGPAAARLLAEVLRPLFGLGLQLQAIAGLTQEAEARRRLDAAVDDLDTMLDELRAGLFDPTAGEVRSSGH